jgi:tetratricopeptide (TPR) repeat protein
MEKATSDDPKYATAWLSLGMIEAATFNNPAALRAFAKAIEADPKFAAPYIEAAAVQSTANDWAKAIENTGYAIALDPEAFPRAYYLNAVAHVRLNDADDALKRADAGIRIDVDREFPDLEFIAGIVLASDNNAAGARKYLESYLAHAPNGVNAAIAKRQLADLPAEK